MMKVAFSAVTVLMAPWGPDVLAVSALLVLATAYAFHAKMQPCATRSLNWLESLGLATVCGTLFGGLYILSPNVSETVRSSLSVAIIAGNAFCVAAFAHALWRSTRDIRRRVAKRMSKLRTRRSGTTTQHRRKVELTDWQSAYRGARSPTSASLPSPRLQTESSHGAESSSSPSADGVFECRNPLRAREGSQ